MNKALQFAELAHADGAKERKEQYDKNKRPHGIDAGDSVYMWIARDNKLQQSAMGPMVVKRLILGSADQAHRRVAPPKSAG